MKNFLYSQQLTNHLVVCVLIVAVTSFGICQDAMAQAAQQEEYQVIELPEQYDIPNRLDYDPASVSREFKNEVERKRDALKVIEKQMVSAFKGEASVTDQQLVEFFNAKYFANLTQTTPRKLSEYGKLRNDFFRFYMARSNGNMRTRMLTLTFNTMSQVASENFHPAARVNALLMIGQLDTARGQTTRGGSAPVPYANALPFLMDIVADDNSEEYLKIAALVGVERHCCIQPRNGERARISQTMQNLMAAPAEDQPTTDAGYWIRRRAVRTLGCLKDPVVASQLSDIIVDTNENIWLRVDALTAYSQLEFSDPSQSAGFEISQAINALVASVARKEAETVVEKISSIREVALFLDEEDPTTASSKKNDDAADSGVGMGEMFDGNDNSRSGRAAAQSVELLPVYQRKLIRQRVKTVVYSALQVLDKKEADAILEHVVEVYGQGSDEAKYVAAVTAELNRLMSATDIVDIRGRRRDVDPDDNRTRAQKLHDVLSESANNLDELLASIQPEEEPEKDGAEEDATGEASSETADNSSDQ